MDHKLGYGICTIISMLQSLPSSNRDYLSQRSWKKVIKRRKKHIFSWWDVPPSRKRKRLQSTTILRKFPKYTFANISQLVMRLCHPPDGSTSPKYKLLHFSHHNLFYQIQNAVAFNWDTCCNLALCLRLLPFHWSKAQFFFPAGGGVIPPSKVLLFFF